MRQVKKENHYYFGMKLHNCLDSRTGLVQNLNATSANVHEVTEAHRLLHGGERRAWEDVGYTGVQKRESNPGLAVDWQGDMNPDRRQKLAPDSTEALREKVKASVRVKAEHLFLAVKRIFGYDKAHTRGWPRIRTGCRCCLGCPTQYEQRIFRTIDPGQLPLEECTPFIPQTQIRV